MLRDGLNQSSRDLLLFLRVNCALIEIEIILDETVIIDDQLNDTLIACRSGGHDEDRG